MNVNPGKLDKRIEIMRSVTKEDADGFKKKEFETFKKPWASVSQKSANESFKSNTELATSQKRFLIRYIKGLTYDMTIKYDGQEYDIKFIHDYEDKHEYVELIGVIRGANGRIGT